jgi:hypothetical protein
MTMLDQLGNFLSRMRVWLAVTAALMLLMWWLAPQQLSVVSYKAVLLTLATVLAYQIDRGLFQHAPSMRELLNTNPVLAAARLIARALVFLGVVLGVTLGI